jgi:hypothetical protein
MQTLEDGEDGALDVLLGLKMGIDHSLGICSHVLE